MLSNVFFLEQPIDLEHKQYILMAYFQKLEKMFKENDVTGLEEVRYHTKNVECFISTRGILEARGFPLSKEQKKIHEASRNILDTDPEYNEATNICKWALKKLQEKSKEGGLIVKRVEGSLKMFFIGKEFTKSSGYLMIRYLGSHIAEVYKMTYDEKTRSVSFRHLENYSMPGKKDFGDVKIEILEKEQKVDDLFVAVEGQLAFNTKKTILPVLKTLLVTNVSEKKPPRNSLFRSGL